MEPSSFTLDNDYGVLRRRFAVLQKLFRHVMASHASHVTRGAFHLHLDSPLTQASLLHKSLGLYHGAAEAHHGRGEVRISFCTYPCIRLCGFAIRFWPLLEQISRRLMWRIHSVPPYEMVLASPPA